MQNIISPTQKTLKSLLKHYSQNIERNSFPFSISEKSDFEFQKCLVTAFDNLRLKNVDLEQFDNPTTAIISILISGNSVGIQAIAKNLTFAACLQRPSLINLSDTGILDEGKIIKTIGFLIDNLSKYFGGKTSQSLEEISWVIFDKYSYFSLEDMILFFSKCKERAFATEYQHITSRGINAEFLLTWLEKYDEQRTKEQKSLILQMRADNLGSFVCPKHIASLKEIKNKVHIQNQKRLQWKDIERNSKRNEKFLPPVKRLADFYSDRILLFKDENQDKSSKEIYQLAKRQAEKILAEWQIEFDNLVQETTIKQEKPSELTLRGFKERKLHSFFLLAKQTGLAPSAKKLLHDAFVKFIEKHSVVCGGDFLSLMCNGKEFSPCSLRAAKNKLLFQLEKNMSSDYKKRQKMILENQTDFLSKPDYFRLWAWRWICDKRL